MATAPQTTSDQGQRITEGGLLLSVPSRRANNLRLVFDQAVGQQCHQRKQPKQNGCRARNSPVAPLPLRLNSEVRPRLFKGHFHAPTSYEPSQNLRWLMRQFSREKHTRLKFSPHIPSEQAQGLASGAPQTGLAVDLDLALAAAVPILELDLLPFRLGSTKRCCGDARRAPLIRGRPCCPGRAKQRRQSCCQ